MGGGVGGIGGGGGAPPASDAPHEPQNCAFAATAALQRGQAFWPGIVVTRIAPDETRRRGEGVTQILAAFAAARKAKTNRIFRSTALSAFRLRRAATLPRKGGAEDAMTGVVTLYGSSASGNCLKPKWVAALVGQELAWIETDSFSGATRQPDFLALNPAGQVPVAILAGGRALAQSNAIMLHFAEGSRLIPEDAYARAKMFEWLFWEQYSHEPAIAVRIARRYYQKQGEEDLDPALKSKGEAALARMELQLSETPYLVGDALTLADIALVAYTRNAHRGGFELSHYPAVKVWIARVEADLGLDPPADR